jgi:hypothetical protein
MYFINAYMIYWKTKWFRFYSVEWYVDMSVIGNNVERRSGNGLFYGTYEDRQHSWPSGWNVQLGPTEYWAWGFDGDVLQRLHFLSYTHSNSGTAETLRSSVIIWSVSRNLRYYSVFLVVGFEVNICSLMIKQFKTIHCSFCAECVLKCLCSEIQFTDLSCFLPVREFGLVYSVVAVLHCRRIHVLRGMCYINKF